MKLMTLLFALLGVLTSATFTASAASTPQAFEENQDVDTPDSRTTAVGTEECPCTRTNVQRGDETRPGAVNRRVTNALGGQGPVRPTPTGPGRTTGEG